MNTGEFINMELMVIRIVHIKGREVNDILDHIKNHPNPYRKLPEYCLKKENGEMWRSEDYFEKGADETIPYWLFDIKFTDQMLQSEIDGAGIDDFCKGDYRPLFQKLPHYKSEEDSIMSYGGEAKLIFKVTTWASEDHYSGGYDVEAQTKLYGYLDESLNKWPFGIKKAIIGEYENSRNL